MKELVDRILAGDVVDVMESFDTKFNPVAELVEKYYPQDRNGFNEAIYKVRISVEIQNEDD